MDEKTEVTPLPAATVTLVRDAPRGLQVLMLQRSLSLAFMPGVHVFPGGALDAADNSPDLHALCVGLDDAAASRMLGLDRGGLSYWIAAIREAGIASPRPRRRGRGASSSSIRSGSTSPVSMASVPSSMPLTRAELLEKRDAKK